MIQHVESEYKYRKYVFEVTSCGGVRAMNQKLRIVLLCEDQCHCWEIGHGKQGK